jgi:hypothetical protein
MASVDVLSVPGRPTRNISAAPLTASKNKEWTNLDAASVMASDFNTGSKKRVRTKSTKFPMDM